MIGRRKGADGSGSQSRGDDSLESVVIQFGRYAKAKVLNGSGNELKMGRRCGVPKSRKDRETAKAVYKRHDPK